MRPRARALAGAAVVASVGCAFCALFGVLFAPVMVAHRFIGDPVDQLLETLPAYLGDRPLWEPRTMLGYPLAADPNQASFYPLALLHRIAGLAAAGPAGSSGFAGAYGSFDAYELAAYVIAACGTFGLVRATTRSSAGAAAAALVYSLGGFMIAQAGHVSIVEPAAWVPFVFWSLTEMRERTRAARASLGCIAAIAFAILAGQPQPIVYALYFAIPYALVVARRADDGVRPYALRASVALVLGVACAGIALVPETELFRASARATFGFERFGEFTVPVLQQPIRSFFPYALGASGLWPYAHSAIDVGSFAEMSDYAGIGGIVFAVVALRRARRAPFTGYWVAAAASALVLATGNQLGLGFLTYHVPLYGLFRAPGRIGAETDLAIAVLCGIGIAAVESGRASVTDVRRACTIASFAMGFAFALFLAISRMPPNVQLLVVSGRADLDANPLENAALAIPFVTLASLAAVAIFWARRPASRARTGLLVAAVLADMLGFAGFAYWRSGAFGADRLGAPSYAVAVRAGLRARDQRVVSVPLPGVDDGGIGPNLNLLWDVPSLRGYTPLQLAGTHALYDSDWDVPVWPHASAADATLDLAAVRYVVVVESPDVAADHASVDPVTQFLREGPRWRVVLQAGNDTILENERALPRAWIVRRALPAAGTDVLAAIRTRAFDPRTTAFVAGLARAEDGAAAAGDTAAVASLSGGRMLVRTRCAARCFLVTSDATYPGWWATVDGAATTLYAVDAAVRGVFVPAGRHAVTFRYEPRIYAFGAAVSCLAIVLAIAWAAMLRLRPPRGERSRGV